MLLGVGVVATGLLSEALASDVTGFARRIHVTEFFLAVIVVAIVGNAAEHGAGIIVAAKGNVELGVEVALRSAAQVSAMLLPAVALLSWLLHPLPLAFHPVELCAWGAAGVLGALAVADGRSQRRRGAAPLSAYPIAVVAFFVSHGRPS